LKLFNRLGFIRPSPPHSFDNIIGYEDIKNIVRRVLDAEDSYNLLFIGESASSKTQFLMEIMKAREGKTVYFDATNTTNRILQVLEEERPEIILLDELDKLPRNFAEKLLNFLESGRVKVDQKNCQMDFELKGCKVFATANEINRLSKPLQSRFRKLFLPRYTEEQFLDVSEKALSKTSPSIARYIAANVWKNGGDIRDCISIGKLVRKNDGPEEIAEIIGTITKYGDQQDK
jgi:replication-associated recombination protein RarA